MPGVRLLNRARVPTQADLAIPNQQPRGAVQLADGITAHFVFLMGAHKRLRDLSGDGAILTKHGGAIEGAESSYVSQDSGTQGFYTGNIESLAGKPVTLVFFGEKGRLTATTPPYRVLFGLSDSSLVDGSSTWRISLGNDFGAAGTKELVRYEGPNSTGLYINGHKQADPTLSDSAYAVGARVNVVTTVSALPAGGSTNIWVGSQGPLATNKFGMKGHVDLVAVIEGELSESKCLALSAGDYSVLFKAANDSPFLAPAAAGGVTVGITVGSLNFASKQVSAIQSVLLSLITPAVSVTPGAVTPTAATVETTTRDTAALSANPVGHIQAFHSTTVAAAVSIAGKAVEASAALGETLAAARVSFSSKAATYIAAFTANLSAARAAMNGRRPSLHPSIVVAQWLKAHDAARDAVRSRFLDEHGQDFGAKP